jgi:hypothetical protein
MSRTNGRSDPVKDRPLLVVVQPGVSVEAVGEPATPPLYIIACSQVRKLGQDGRDTSSERKKGLCVLLRQVEVGQHGRKNLVEVGNLKQGRSGLNAPASS